QLNDVQRQIQGLESKSSSKEEVQKLNASVAQQTNQLLKSNADTGVKLEDLSRQIETLQGKLEDTNRRLAELSQQMAASQGELVRPATPPGAAAPPAAPVPGAAARPRPAPASSSVPSPQQLFDTAY